MVDAPIEPTICEQAMTETPSEPKWLEDPDMMMLTRMRRTDEAKWRDATSWFGGLPVLGNQAWPVIQNDPWQDMSPENVGKPLHHIATIDLSKIPRGDSVPPLPDAGRLSFFVDTAGEDEDTSCSVIYTAEQDAGLPVAVPENMSVLYGYHWDYHLPDFASEEEAPRQFNRWPIDLHLFQMPPSEDDHSDEEEVLYEGFQKFLSEIGPEPEGIYREASETGTSHLEMITGPTAVFEQVPEPIRTELTQNRVRSGWTDQPPHHMFGRYYGSQYGYKADDDVILLSAQCDDMMRWMWADVGELTFTISPEDLLAGRFDRVHCTIQGG